jgi:protein-S-isoprenylcysteine O-methyltransferase Ste14
MSSRLFALARAAVVAAFFVSLWTWFFPRWFARSKGVALELHPTAVSIALMVAGAAIMLRCVWDFAWTGRGTPAPFDPPRRLVVNGLYRWVRNPMYVGMGVFLIGEALALPAVTREMLIMAAVCWIAVTGFILLYEEPTLRRLFGDDYIEYCRNVRRWIPRLTPFDKPEGAAVTSPDLD